MGGDSFQGIQKLTNQQYTSLIAQILQITKDLYIMAQTYIPLPQKTMHGDIDFIMILKEGVTPNAIIEHLKIQKFLASKDHTSMHTVYKNKQVDFKFERNNQQFDMVKFYKSYSGLGGFLGVFLPSKQIKLTQKGLFAMVLMQHVKFQYLITNKPYQILKFYGLDYEVYQKCFTKRQQLLRFLCKCKFINLKQFHLHTYSDQPKLTKLLKQYLKQNHEIQLHEPICYKEPSKQTLNYFNKYAQFQQKFEQMLKYEKRKQILNKKFNSSHLITEYKISPKQVDKAKNKFKQSFNCEKQYLSFIQNSQLKDILQRFIQVVDVQKFIKEQDREQMERKWKMFKTIKKNEKKQEIKEQI